MALAVVTVAAGGLPVVDVTATTPLLGSPVSEAANGRGIAVTKMTGGKPGLAVTYVTAAGPMLALAPDPAAVPPDEPPALPAPANQDTMRSRLRALCLIVVRKMRWSR